MDSTNSASRPLDALVARHEHLLPTLTSAQVSRIATGGVELDHEQLLALIQTDSELSEIFMRAFMVRRLELIAHNLGDAVVIGSAHSAGTLRIKEFLTRNGHPFQYIDWIATARRGWISPAAPTRKR